MSTPLLEVQELVTVFPASPSRAERRVVDGVSFELARGEVLGLVGESGSGKSLTVRSLLRLVPPPGEVRAGRVLLDGEELLRAAPARLRELRGGSLGYVFQEPASALDPLARIGGQIAETIRAHRGVSRRAARDEAVDWLERVGLPDPAGRARQYPHELSGGMRQRVLLALALAPRPSILIADEPTTALDVATEARIVELILELARVLDLAVLFISHDLPLVASIADRLAIFDAGRVVETGTPEALLGQPTEPTTRRLVAASRALRDGGRS